MYSQVERQGKNKKACRRATNQTTGTKQNNMKGAYIITYVGKGVNHEKINNRRTQKKRT